MRNYVLKCTCFFVLISMVIFNMSLPAFAEINRNSNDIDCQDDLTNLSEENIASEHATSHKTQISILLDCVNSGEQIQVSFDDPNIEYITYVEDAVEIILSSETYVAFRLVPEIEFGTLEIVFMYTNGHTYTEIVYVYNRAGKSFISSFSIDDAFTRGLDYAYNQGLISQSDWNAEYAAFIQDFFYIERNTRSYEDISADNTLSPEYSVSTTSSSSNSLILLRFLCAYYMAMREKP